MSFVIDQPESFIGTVFGTAPGAGIEGIVTVEDAGQRLTCVPVDDVRRFIQGQLVSVIYTDDQRYVVPLEQRTGR